MADESKFETARTRELLAGELSKLELSFVQTIEEYGHQVLGVAGSSVEQNWSYTLGLFNTCGKPELLTVGLPSATAASAFDDAAKLLRQGVDLTAGRQDGLVGKVSVVFRPADPKWIKILMNSARWFNEGWDFPALQMIYPDMAGRFQWEEGFDEWFRQPLFQIDAPETEVERDFRELHDPEGKFYNWKFPDTPHTQAYLSKTVQDKEEAVTYVSHDADGDWQFLGDKMADGGGPVLSCLHHPIDADASLKELADLPMGWYAEREAVGEPWIRREHPEAADESES